MQAWRLATCRRGAYDLELMMVFGREFLGRAQGVSDMVNRTDVTRFRCCLRYISISHSLGRIFTRATDYWSGGRVVEPSTATQLGQIPSSG